MYFQNILQTIGQTPLVQLNRIVNDCPARVLAKVETTNPGNSTKDRMALKMVEDAEAAGLLREGGTIIECTSGNTGMGLAIVAAVKGYQCIFTATVKQSREKIAMLEALGAKVVLCPSDVAPDDPRSYYKVAEQLHRQTPNSYWCNQYDNLSNAKAHFEGTGPEIWEQTNGKVTHFIVGIGTGGTISGIGQYLKSKQPSVRIWGVDPYGSVLTKYHKTGVVDRREVHAYTTEGIGQDMIPGNVDFGVIDHIEKVSDKAAAIMTKRIAREEGILVGNSAGAALAGLMQLSHLLKPSDTVVVLFHDHASRYLSKIFNEKWMQSHGFEEELAPTDVFQFAESLQA